MMESLLNACSVIIFPASVCAPKIKHQENRLSQPVPHPLNTIPALVLCVSFGIRSIHPIRNAVLMLVITIVQS